MKLEVKLPESEEPQVPQPPRWIVGIASRLKPVVFPLALLDFFLLYALKGFWKEVALWSWVTVMVIYGLCTLYILVFFMLRGLIK